MFKITNPFGFIHFLFGSIAILAGIASLISPKGSRFHRLMGNIYYYSLLIMATAAIISVQPHPQYIHIALPLLAIYLVITGKRTVTNKLIHAGILDRILMYINLVNGIILTGIGLILLIGTLNIVGLLILFFGSLSLSFYLADRVSILGRKKHNDPKYPWLYFHSARMSFSFMFLLSGLFVNQTAELLQTHWFVIISLLPFVMGIPIWFWWRKNYTDYYNNWLARSKK